MVEDDKAKIGHKNQRSRRTKPKTTSEIPKEEQKVQVESDDEGELCFICTEPVITFAVAQCDHRTCHRCTLRLRALYETRNCAYCKVGFTTEIVIVSMITEL